jgi:hypothetical protein
VRLAAAGCTHLAEGISATGLKQAQLAHALLTKQRSTRVGLFTLTWRLSIHI